MCFNKKRFVLCVNTSLDGKIRPSVNPNVSFCSVDQECADLVRDRLKDNTTDVFTTVETIISQGNQVWKFKGEKCDCNLFVLDWNSDASIDFYQDLAKSFKGIIVVCPSTSPMIDQYATINGVSYIDIEMNANSEDEDEDEVVVLGDVDEEDNDISGMPIPYNKILEVVAEISTTSTIYIISQSEIMNAELLMYTDFIRELAVSVLPALVLNNDVPCAFVTNGNDDNGKNYKFAFTACDVSHLVGANSGDIADIAELIYKVEGR